MGNIRGGTLGFHGTIGQPTAQVIDGSLKFAKSEYLQRTPSSAGDRSVYTGSVWVKRSEFAPENNSNSNALSYTIFSAGTNTANNIDNIQFYKNAGDDSNRIAYESYPGSFQYNLMTTPRYRDPNGWYNVVWNYDGTTAKIYVNGEQVTSFDTNTQNGGSGGHFNNTVSHVIGHSPDAGYSKEYAGYMSQFYWIDGQVLGPEYFGFTDPLTNTWRPRKVKTSGPNDGTTWSSVSTISSGGANGGNVLTNGFNGSTSGAFEGDTSGATVTVPISTNIIRGGVRVYAAVTSSNPLVVVIKNGDTTVETINAGSSGGKYYGSSTYSGAITSLVISRTGRAPEFNAISINGIILKDNSTTNFEFGTNGFYLPMDNQDDFEKDKSGNGNDFTKNNFSGTSIDPDVVKDSPSGAVFGGRAQTGITTTSSAPSNYCTLNPIDAFVSTKDGNLETVNSSGWQGIRATLGMKSGKFYWETQNNQTAAAILGIADTQATGFVDGAIFGSTGHGGGDANPAWTWAGANYYFNATSAASGSLANHTSSDIVQYAFDADSGNLWFGRNGTWYSSSWATTGDPANGVNPTVSGIDTTKTYVACGSFYNGSGKFNFGQRPFKYAPPQGFLPLNSASARPETVFARPDRYIQVLKYTGDDATTHSITGLNFGAVPDFVWIKNRDQSEKHILHDTVRGVGDTLYSTSDDHDTGSTYSDRYKSFDLNGFTVGSTHTSTNSNGDDFSAVCWKAGGSSNTFNVDGVGYASAADAGLDGGDLTVTGASVGTKQGFSIIKYQGSGSGGDQVPHGLLQTPNLAFVKQAGNSGSGTPWDVYHSGYYAAGSKNYLRLNNDDGAGYASDMFQTPTSSFMTFGSSNSQNGSSYNYIMYCWHDVPGLQKFGSYTGNGSDDGPFIETGFRPTLIWTRAHTGSGITNNAGWFIYDTLDDSNPYNDDVAVNQPGNYITYANLLNPLQSHAAMGIDILSNGFRLRADPNAYSNYDGWDYIYGAFAAAPVSNLYGGQSNAR